MQFAKPLLISFSLLAFAGVAAADEAAKNRSAGQGAQQIQGASESASATASSEKSGGEQNMSEMRATELMDKKVVGRDGDDLGEIKDVVVDLETGKVHAAVLEFGGILGVGEKHYAFPVSELKPGKDADKLAMDIDKDKLKNAEGFAKGQWPEMNDEYWGRVGQQSQSSAGSGGTQQGQKANLMRASKMIGQDVQDKSGKDVGEIKDLVINLQDGELKNVVIDVKDAGQAMVEPKSLSTGTGDKLLVSMDEQELKSSAQKKTER
jgi:sporulation protein YlmC with PRC-barrel domain